MKRGKIQNAGTRKNIENSKIVFARRVLQAPSSSLAAKVEKLAGPVYPRSQENLNAKMPAW